MIELDKTSPEKNGNPVGAAHYVVLFAALGLVAAGLCLAAGSRVRQKERAAAEENAFIDSLHVFPEVDFVDSLYARVELKKYDNEAGSPRDVYYYAVDSAGRATDEVVHETHFYDNEQKYIDGNIKSDKRDGLWYAYYPDGTVQTMAYYKDGKENGRYTVFYPDGKVRYTGLYKYGEKIGEWRFYNADGTVNHKEDY